MKLPELPKTTSLAGKNNPKSILRNKTKTGTNHPEENKHSNVIKKQGGAQKIREQMVKAIEDNHIDLCEAC